MPLWKELLKLSKSARGNNDAVSAMFDEIIKVRPDLKGALDFVKAEYKIGNISGEAAKRAANMTERGAGARGTSVLDRLDVKTLGDYGTTRNAARESMSGSAFDRIDDRIKNYSLKGDEALKPKDSASRNVEARNAELVDDDYNFFDDNATKKFDDAFNEIRERELGGSSKENLDRGWRREQSGLEGTPSKDFENAIKSGLSVQDAAEEVVRNSAEKYGFDLDFNDVIELARKDGRLK